MLFKVLQSVLYYFFLIFGFIGLGLFAKKEKKYILLFIPIYLIVLFCFVVRVVEWRLFAYSFISLFFGATYLLGIIHKKLITKNKNNGY